MRAARRDLPALTRLWQACFGDTEAEVRAFWQALFDCTPVYLRRAPDGWQSLRELQLYDSHLSYPPELLRWQETISRSSGAGLYRIETGDAVCCAAAERDGETLLVRELLPDCPEAAAALADKLGCREAVFRTAGGTQPFGMAKSLDGTPLPQRAYLGPAFE